MMRPDKNTVENLIILLAGTFLYIGMVNMQWIGQYIKSEPLWVVSAGVILIFFAGKIAEKVPGMEQSKTKGIIYLIAGVFLFNGVAGMQQLSQYYTGYPYIVVGAAILLFIFKDSISNAIGGN